jgi:tRNA threonylcarbamoyladenosine biosynthesis protein TsaE
MNIISKNIKHTEKIAQDFLKCLLNKKNKNACVVGLSGELGAGKTAFTQAIAKTLGIKRRVNSPTFVIMKRYTLKHKNFENLFHLDAYRLKNEKELVHLGWEEIIANPKYLVFIEWPENIIKAMPKKYHKVSISHLPAQVGTKEGHRSFEIKTS